MAHSNPPAEVSIVTLSRAELLGMLEQAAQRGAERALAKAKPAPNAPQLLSRTQLGQLLGISTATLDRQIRDGMPFVRVGAHRRFDHGAVTAWLSAQQEGS